MTTTDIHTAEQLLNMPDDGMRRELVRGELKTMAPAGGRHGGIEMLLGARMTVYVVDHHLGHVVSGDTGFVLRRDPDTVRLPDVAFIRNGRLPDNRLPDGLIELAPDLAVEVVSPNDRHKEVLEKVDEWLEAGVRLVWVVSPTRREITAYATGQRPVTYMAGDEIAAEELLPGFRVNVGSVFPR